MTSTPPPSGPAHPIAGYPAAPIVVAPNVLSTIPYPTNLPTGPVPTALPFMVIVNSSPYALLVSQGQVLTQIAAYTQDIVQLPQVNGRAGVTVLPLAGVANIAPGADATIYATWYPADPGGQYPAAIGAGAIPIGTSTNLTPVAGSAVNLGPGQESFGFGIVTGGVDAAAPPGWVQAVAVYIVQTGGTASGVEVSVGGGLGKEQGVALVGTVQPQTFYVPVNGAPFIVKLTDIGIGFTGTIFVYGLVGPVTAPRLSGPNQNPVLGSSVLSASVLAAGTSAVSPPNPGYQLRIVAWSFAFAVAPTAGGVVLIRATGSATPLMRHAVPAAVSDALPWSGSVWIPDVVSVGFLVPDGFTFVNSASQTCSTQIIYETWPTPLEPH